MRLSETRDRFVSELSFPVDRETVVERLGDAELDPPTGEPETIGEVIARSDQDSFQSVDDLYDALVAFVGDQYVGRKFYDDRGSNLGVEGEEVSF